MLFFIEMCGSIIAKGKLGIYIVESLFLFWTLLLLFKIGNIISPSNIRRIIFSISATLIVFIYTIEAGNTNEQYSLPFVLYPLLVTSRYYFQNRKFTLVSSLLCGICFGCVSLIRLNNTAIIVGLCIALAIEYIIRREYKTLLKLIISFILGVVIAVLPFIIYFASQNALYDALYASVLYNIKYKAAWGGDTRYIENIARLLSCVVLPIVSLVYDRIHHTRISLFCVAISLVTFLTFYSGVGYGHYYTMQLPILFLCCIIQPFNRRIYYVAAFLIVCAPFARNIYQRCIVNYYIKTKTYQQDKPYYNLYKDLQTDNDSFRTKVFNIIPMAERNSIYINQSMTFASVFIGTEFYPTGKYFSQQTNISKIDDYVKSDVIKQFNKAKPKWIISSCPIDGKNFISLVLNYHLVAQFPLSYSEEHVYIFKINDANL
jgi:hypothetical protein